ncbi:TIGR04282 family arsenosugar biosynthesis glycosyltransferase [Desulfogranum marinum]|uniref:TIGR04282 family arsenosugar biosynthesis glycosyltransferase n=1 Tax=Desulfogranum marinum TaxID=453220 RepID=UPI001963FFBB|nr:TIGR04282 family arsenosugar biosynthesis glycosyltransferase [Desulfogranum marinum]MBM9511827.1 TIGR04282 family arsenosugar biosynthesis glycosyltransferase [Desulfogranum marinum]
MYAPRRLILFTRFPQPGTTKTRLIPQLGPHGAAELQRKMTELMIQQALLLRSDQATDIFVYYDGGTVRQMEQWLGKEFRYVKQHGKDIGMRMYNAFMDGYTDGAEHIILIGCDIPAIDTPLLKKAFSDLTSHTAVIGPSTDGGYYLIGIHRQALPWLLSSLFTDITWSTSKVCKQTIAALKKHHITFAPLPLLPDIDRPDDLDTLPSELLG